MPNGSPSRGNTKTVGRSKEATSKLQLLANLMRPSDMKAKASTFSRSMSSCSMLQELMDREKVDALAFMSEGLIKFASNWSLDVASFERPTVFVFPRDGEPFGILHELST